MAEFGPMTLVTFLTFLCVTGVRSQSQQAPTAADTAGSNWFTHLKSLFAAGSDGQGQSLTSLDGMLREQQPLTASDVGSQQPLQEAEPGPQAGTGMYGLRAANVDLVSLFGMGVGQGLQDLAGVPSPVHGPAMAAGRETGPQMAQELNPALDPAVTTPRVMEEPLGSGADLPGQAPLPLPPLPGAESGLSPAGQVQGPLTVHTGKKRLAPSPARPVWAVEGRRGQLLRELGLLTPGQRPTDVTQQALRLLASGASLKGGLEGVLGLVPTIHGAPLANTIKNTLRLSALKGPAAPDVAPLVLAR